MTRRYLTYGASLLTTACVLGLAAPAQADFVLDTTNTSTETDSNNDFDSQLSNLGYVGLRIGGDADVLTFDEDAKLEFEFHATEAGFDNTFDAGGNGPSSTAVSDFNDWDDPGKVFGTQQVQAGDTLPWQFTTDDSDGTKASLGSDGFGIFTDGNGNLVSKNEVFLGYDDGGGSEDDNHDDMIVSVNEVPAPATFALIGGGLVLVGVSVRLRGARPTTATAEATQ